jgi:hypothetical protein
LLLYGNIYRHHLFVCVAAVSLPIPDVVGLINLCYKLRACLEMPFGVYFTQYRKSNAHVFVNVYKKYNILVHLLFPILKITIQKMLIDVDRINSLAREMELMVDLENNFFFWQK